MSQVNAKKSNKKFAEDLCKFDKVTIFRLLDRGLLKITPLRITKGVFDKENLDKIQDLIDLGLIEIAPDRLDSKNTYEDWISLLRYDVKDLEKTIDQVVNCPCTKDAWSKLSLQRALLQDQITILNGIRRRMVDRCKELYEHFEGPKVKDDDDEDY